MEKILINILIFLLVFATLKEGVSWANPVVRIPLYASQISLDPTNVQDQSSLWVSRHINCQIIREVGGKLELEAADKVYYKDPLNLIIEIKKGITFNDGSLLTARDVLATFQFLEEKRNIFRSIFEWIKGISIVNDHSIIINLEKPNTQILQYLSSPNYIISKKDFLENAAKDSTVWKKPVGCGAYHIKHSDNKSIQLEPRIRKNMPEIHFYFTQGNQISVHEIDSYDVISLSVEDKKELSKDFEIVKIFDPYHVFLGLNVSQERWKKRENRCHLFSKLDFQKVIDRYEEDVEVAKDVLPRGILGYTTGIDYPAHLRFSQYNGSYPKEDFCLGLLSVSIPQKYRKDYAAAFEVLFDTVRQINIVDPKSFGDQFQRSECDALVLGLKSNVLDAYEYLLTLSEQDANFTGYWDPNLIEKIKDSQNVSNMEEKASRYQTLTSMIRNQCLYYPILTIPMKEVFVRKGLYLPDLGTVPLNEYFIGNGKWRNK